MIEVRTAYLVKMPDAEGPVEELAQQCREEIWPLLGWQGRFQQMLHGHAQQSLFVWSFQWASLAAWEQAMTAAEECGEYRSWCNEIAPRLRYGAGQEILSRATKPCESQAGQSVGRGVERRWFGKEAMR